MPGQLGPLSEATHAMVEGGSLVALAAVCLLQYVHLLTHRRQSQRVALGLRRETDDLNVELMELSRERAVQRVELQLLREVLAQTDGAKALQAILRRYIPQTEDAFAAFLPSGSHADAAAQSRGLSAESRSDLRCDAELLEELKLHGAIAWDPPTSSRCSLYSQLSAVDRRKARQLFAFAVADDEGLVSVLLTTSLLPIAAPRQDQIDLAKRLMQSIAPTLRYNLNREHQATQLQCTREMLELRSIADGKYDQPLSMLERFLMRLGQMLSADRVALYLSSRDEGGAPKPVVRCGVQLQPGVAEGWQNHEERLARSNMWREYVTAIDEEHLQRMGIDTLIRSAATTPVMHHDNTIGVVCITRGSSAPWSINQRQLLSWSGETISQAFQRVLSFAAIERQARQDSLTGLANRRTFDSQLQSEIAALREGALVECSLLLLDVDRFKSVNDVYGHQAGDEVLRETGRLLREQVSRMRSNDRVLMARYGGEELAILLPGVGIHGARRLAESIRGALEDHVTTVNGAAIRVTISIGAATCPLHAHTAETLVAAADVALYNAKSTGRNRVECAADPLGTSTLLPSPPATPSLRQEIAV